MLQVPDLPIEVVAATPHRYDNAVLSVNRAATGIMKTTTHYWRFMPLRKPLSLIKTIFNSPM